MGVDFESESPSIMEPSRTGHRTRPLSSGSLGGDAPVYERHENEQYFFDQETIERLAGFVAEFESPCLLCAPLLGQELARTGVAIRILDIDERFAHLAGFRRYDIYRPEWLGEEYDLILCDPPFYNVSLSQLFSAIRTLARNDFAQPLLLSYLARRSSAVLGTFAKFQLEPTGYLPTYQTVEPTPRNQVEFYSNLEPSRLQRLVADAADR